MDWIRRCCGWLFDWPAPMALVVFGAMLAIAPMLPDGPPARGLRPSRWDPCSLAAGAVLILVGALRLRMTIRRPRGAPRAGKRMLIDPAAESADPDLPAFLARPAGAPVYHGFPLLEESRTDGWCLGTISAFTDDPLGCEWGDAFVVAPDGSRAGLVWQVGSFPLCRILPPTRERWGVYQVPFPRAVRTVDDLVRSFRAILPELQAIHAQVRGPGPR